MFEKEAEEYTKKLPFVYETELVRKIVRMFCKNTFEDAAEFGYNEANRWHLVKDGDLPKENQECYFIYSNTYDDSNKVSFAKSYVQVRTGVYSFSLDDEGNQTTEPCFYDDINDEEIDLSEVYAWKEVVLPELKEE